MDIERISIKDIADTADINRKTFYSYYDGIYQVAEEIEDEMIRAFEETLLEDGYMDMYQIMRCWRRTFRAQCRILLSSFRNSAGF